MFKLKLKLLFVSLVIANVLLAQTNFYVKKNGFEETLSASFKKINKYEAKNGFVFISSDEINPEKPVKFSIATKNANTIYFRSLYASGYEEMWDVRVMIPSMRFNMGDPVWETSSTSSPLESDQLVSIHPLTQRMVNLRIANGKTWKLGKGNTGVEIKQGKQVQYHWVGEVELKVPQGATSFTTWIAPHQGGIYGMIYTDGFAEFLQQLKSDFPKETNILLGDQFRYLNRLEKLKTRDFNLDEYLSSLEIAIHLTTLANFDFEALQLAIEDLQNTYGNNYPDGQKYLNRLKEIKHSKNIILKGIADNDQEAIAKVHELVELQKTALFANPAIDFENFFYIKRSKIKTGNSPIGQGPDPFGLPSNFQSLSMINRNIWDNEIASYSWDNRNSETIFKPENNHFVGLFDLHFDADKMLISMPSEDLSWQVYETDLTNKTTRQVSPTEEAVDNYDACYLPNEDIIFSSTRNMHGVPCVSGTSDVANLCRMDKEGKNIRMLCFDQDDNWHPTLLNNGKVLYTRWEYTDEPHYFSRLLMNMNPDGTNQKEYYGSSSYWPNSIFYAKAIPNHPTKVVGIVSGHHGTRRSGQLVIFDPVKGRFETEGVVQEIPHRGKKMEATIKDRLVDDVWPKFLTPYPINEKYFLVAMQRNPYDNFGIYLVDVFNNMVPVLQDADYSFFEPVPLKKQQRPPVIPDKVDLTTDEATVYITDINEGRSMKNVPNGTIKALRVFEYNYAVRKVGGHIHIGIDGPWDARKILGTVPVYEDGSAYFKIPANTPIAVQPLDEKGQAVQIMRSWFSAMPGERLSCVGCHEEQNQIVPAKYTTASRKQPSEIKEWYGPARGFSFKTEVQPVLDKYCVGCHNPTRDHLPDFTRKEKDSNILNAGRKGNFAFTPSYINLHPYVRRTGNEGDYRAQNAYEYHAETSELVQMLRKGHHNVEMDKEAWDRLITWIDLNVPDHGSWTEFDSNTAHYIQLREKYRNENANVKASPEEIAEVKKYIEFVAPKKPEKKKIEIPEVEGWPFSTEDARNKQNALQSKSLSLAVKGGLKIDLVKIPAGEFVMANSATSKENNNPKVVSIEKPFYMATCEITNEIYKQFKEDHDQGVINFTSKDVDVRGHILDEDKYPAIRISYNEAKEFCKWLSGLTGKKVKLPTEEQWEWACRAGSDSDFYFGNKESDFSQFANLADQSLKKLAVRSSPAWHPRDDRFSDEHTLLCDVKSLQPNAFGLYDMHGNATEWTSSEYENGKKTVRGGSWYDRPHRATSSYKLGYYPHQRVFNVGFRIVVEE